MQIDTRNIAALTALVGERFSTKQANRDQHAGHETHHAPQPPDSIAWPLTTEDLAQIVRNCTDAKVPLIPHGLGSSL